MATRMADMRADMAENHRFRTMSESRLNLALLVDLPSYCRTII